MKCIFPCILIPDGNPGYSVIFPDIAGATQGDTLEEALDMAEDLANFAMSGPFEEGEKIPTPTPPEKVVVPAGAFMTLIRVDTESYERK